MFLDVFEELYTSAARPLEKEVDQEDVDLAGERGGIVAWGESWDINSGEITLKQWKKFGFFYEGCDEVIISANMRRME